MISQHFQHWARDVFPTLNGSLIDEKLSFAEFVDCINREFSTLPSPADSTEREAKQLLVMTGIIGSSVIRYRQGQQVSPAAGKPDAGLDLVRCGSSQVSFRPFFDELVSRAGGGHPKRDAYASLVRWNTPEFLVHWRGTVMSPLESVFDDGKVRTYTNNIGETLILELFKKCETLEKVANQALMPLWLEQVNLSSSDALDRIDLARCMLSAVRRLIIDFPKGDERGVLTVDHFITTFRQFAVHWDKDDVPPSAPQDVEFVKGDILLGIDLPGYDNHVRRIFPGLLMEEQHELSAMMGKPTLPDLLFRQLRIDRSTLEAMPTPELHALASKYPVIAACLFLLQTNARLSASHLALAKSYLFKPSSRKPDERWGRPIVVPNDQGITGLRESVMDRLVTARQSHGLASFERLPPADLIASSGVENSPLMSTSKVSTLLHRRRMGCPPAPHPQQHPQT